MKENPIDKALGLPPLEEDDIDDQNTELVELDDSSSEIELLEDDDYDDETVRDIELARKNIQDIIQKGGDSLEDIIDLAKQSESPRAFEVASNMMKTLLDANKDFIDTSMKKKAQIEERKNKSGSQPGNTTVNNNLILSTTELLKMIRGETKE